MDNFVWFAMGLASLPVALILMTAIFTFFAGVRHGFKHRFPDASFKAYAWRRKDGVWMAGFRCPECQRHVKVSPLFSTYTKDMIQTKR